MLHKNSAGFLFADNLDFQGLTNIRANKVVKCVKCCIFLSVVSKVEPRGLIARRVTEVAQSTLDMVTTAVDYPLCECM